MIKYLISLVEDGLPFPEKPSKMIDKIDLKWAPNMIFEGDSVFGCWMYTSFNSIFLCPEESKNTYYRIKYHAYKMTAEENAKMDYMSNKRAWTDVFLKDDKILDKEEVGFLLHALESEGHLISCTLHELWHRQQFIDSPLKYFISCLATNLIDYDNACSSAWSIEYDVRQKVDTEELHQKLQKLYVPFYEYLILLNKTQIPDLPENVKEETLKKMEEFDDITKKLVEMVKK